jgi:hypothetical protein
MKTVIQELMEWMEKTEFMVNRAFIDKVNECLEKEKHQILVAYEDGYYDGKWDDPNWGEEYYIHNYSKKDKEIPSESKTLLEILDLDNEKNVINDILNKLDKDE